MRNETALTPGRRTIVTIDPPDDISLQMRWSHAWLPHTMPSEERWAGFYGVPASSMVLSRQSPIIGDGESLLAGAGSLTIPTSGLNGWKLTTLKEANRLPGITSPETKLYSRAISASGNYSATSEHDKLIHDANGGFIPALLAENRSLFSVILVSPWISENYDIALIEFRAPGAERWILKVASERLILFSGSYNPTLGYWQYETEAQVETPGAWRKPGMHVVTVGYQQYPNGYRILAGIGNRWISLSTTASAFAPEPTRLLMPADSRWYVDIVPAQPGVASLYLQPAPQVPEARITPGTDVYLLLSGTVTGSVSPYLRFRDSGGSGIWYPFSQVSGADGLYRASPNYSQAYTHNHLGVRVDVAGMAAIDMAKIWVVGPQIPLPPPLSVTGGIIQRVEITLARDAKLDRCVIEADDPSNELGILGVRGDMPISVSVQTSGGVVPLWHGYVTNAVGERIASHSRRGMTNTQAQWPSPYWRKWAIESAGHWRRLEESHVPAMQSLLEPDPFESHNLARPVTYRVTDWLYSALQWANYSPTNLQSREIRVTPGHGSHIVKPHTRVADLVEHLTTGYLGEYLTHHPSLGWRLIENPQPSDPPKLLILTDTLASGGSGYVWTVDSLAPVIISGSVVPVVPAMAVREQVQPPLYTHVVVTGTGDMSPRGFGRGMTQGLFNFKSYNFWGIDQTHANFPSNYDPNYVGRPKPLIVADPSAASKEAVNYLSKRYYGLYCRPRSTLVVQIPLVIKDGDIIRPGDKVRVETWDYVVDQITISISSDKLQTQILTLMRIV